MTIKEIDAALDEGNSLKAITQAYSEIANLKIKRIRGEVERNRRFFQEISFVYGLVKALAIKKNVTIVKQKKTLSVILTSNYRFYGTINADLIDFFISSTSKLQTDRLLINKAAIDYFKARPIFSNCQQMMLKKDTPDALELENLVNIIKEYNQVLIYYSSLKSLLVQVPTVSDITASSIKPQDNKEFKFIFEPELPKVLKFFDSSILTLLLEGTFLESELSRTASRFISMDSAQTEANKFIKEYEKLKSFAKRNMDNNTILENFAIMSAVRKGNTI